VEIGGGVGVIIPLQDFPTFRNFHTLMRYLTLTLLMLVAFSIQMDAQKNVHWTRAYVYNSQQLWMGAPPQLESVTCHDTKGRKVQLGYEKEGKFYPSIQWKYDRKGREVFESHLTQNGKVGSWTKRTYHDDDHYMVTAHGVEKEKPSKEETYFYEGGRLVSKRCEYNTEYPLEFWQYDSLKRITHHIYCRDKTGMDCFEADFTAYDAKTQRWFKRTSSDTRTGFGTVCLDSACLKPSSYRSSTTDGRLWNHLQYEYDAAGREIRVITIDSVNHNRRLLEKKYDAAGNLIESFDHIYPLTPRHLLRREQRDSAGRLRLVNRYEAFGKEQFEKHYEYDGEGRLVHLWEKENYTKRILERQTWTYDASGRCTQYTDSSQNWKKETLEYDAQGRLWRKKVAELDRDAIIFRIVPNPWPEFPWDDRGMIEERIDDFPVAEPDTVVQVWNETTYEYGYDAFDSLATVTRIGYVPERIHRNTMPGGDPPIGGLAWIYRGLSGKMDTLNQQQRGDTLVHVLKSEHKVLRKVVLIQQVPLQIEEFDSLGNLIVLWRHEDYGKPTPPRVLHAAGLPFASNEDSLVARCLLRVLTQTFTTTAKGDTIFRSEHHPNKPVENWNWKEAYVHGRCVREYNSSGHVLTRYWNANELIEKEISEFPSHQSTERYYQYDASGRLLGFRWISGGYFLSGEDYAYPDPYTVVIELPELLNERKVVYQLEYWK
jgi:YD repeat-containing protein